MAATVPHDWDRRPEMRHHMDQRQERLLIETDRHRIRGEVTLARAKIVFAMPLSD